MDRTASPPSANVFQNFQEIASSRAARALGQSQNGKMSIRKFNGQSCLLSSVCDDLTLKMVTREAGQL